MLGEKCYLTEIFSWIQEIINCSTTGMVRFFGISDFANRQIISTIKLQKCTNQSKELIGQRQNSVVSMNNGLEGLFRLVNKLFYSVTKMIDIAWIARGANIFTLNFPLSKRGMFLRYA